MNMIKCMTSACLISNKSFVTECDPCPEGALTSNLKNVEVTVQNKLHYSRKLSGQISSMKINKEQ